MTHTISNIIDLTNAPTPPRWFEFLLEPGRLQQHLGSGSCDPSPTQLISLFFRNTPIIESNTSQSPGQRNGSSSPNSTNKISAPVGSGSEEIKVINNEQIEKVLIDYNDSAEINIPPDSYEAKYRIKKAYALQILSLKVASFLKWNLDVICNDLTIPIQHKLVRALNDVCEADSCPQEVKKFASLTFCHWFLRSAITYKLSTLQPQSSNTTIIYLSQLQQQQQAAESLALSSMSELFAPDSKQLKHCSDMLRNFVWDLTHNKDNSAKKMKGSGHPFKKAKLSRPMVDCFDSRDEKFNDWEKCEPIDSVDVLEAACYDLGRFYFFEESYAMARQVFELIKSTNNPRYPKLNEYLTSARELIAPLEHNGKLNSSNSDMSIENSIDDGSEIRLQTERYLFDCMTQYSKNQKKDIVMDLEQGNEEDHEEDSDLRFEQSNHQKLPENSAWFHQVPELIPQQVALEYAKGDLFMSQGNFKQAMGRFVGALMLATDYFRKFSKNYAEEEPFITRMIQCSISLSCFTQAVALCQMTKTLNYTIAFKQLNERICNDCCDDIYECIWNVTLLEYIINLHAKRGEVERRTRVIQLIGQLELNENNPEEILREAEHVRRGRFFRIMSNKYL